MENYSITKEQVLENYKYALNNQDYLSARNLKEWFPDAFKEEFSVGKWYKGTKRNFLVNYQSDNMENYGFWDNQGFKNNIAFGSYWSNECIEATPQEVEASLITEAKKRFKVGDKLSKIREDSGSESYNRIFNNELQFSGSKLYFYSDFWNCIFDNGKWAEIITEETKEITMEKAVKILSKKYGKKVIIK